jgi:hypothetical protein
MINEKNIILKSGTYKKIEYKNPDAEIINNIIDAIFKQVALCLVIDRSNTKLNIIQKSAIQGVLHTLFGKTTRDGMRQYIDDMYPEDLKEIVDLVEMEIRKKRNR